MLVLVLVLVLVLAVHSLYGRFGMDPTKESNVIIKGTDKILKFEAENCVTDTTVLGDEIELISFIDSNNSATEKDVLFSDMFIIKKSFMFRNDIPLTNSRKLMVNGLFGHHKVAIVDLITELEFILLSTKNICIELISRILFFGWICCKFVWIFFILFLFL